MTHRDEQQQQIGPLWVVVVALAIEVLAIMALAAACHRDAQGQEFIPRWSPAASGNNLIPNLVAFWRFDENTSGNATDASGNGRTLTTNSPVASTSTAIVNYARNYSSTTDSDFFFRTNEAAFNFGTNDFTITAWAYFDSGGGTVTGDMTVISNGDWGNNTMSWWLELDHGTPDSVRLYVSTNGVWDANANVHTDFDESGGVVQAVWYFIAARRSGTNLYLSTTPITSGSVSTNGVFALTDSFNVTGLYANITDNLYVGDIATDHIHDMGGDLDEIGIWSTYLSDCQLGKLFTAKAGAFSYPSFDSNPCTP